MLRVDARIPSRRSRTEARGAALLCCPRQDVRTCLRARWDLSALGDATRPSAHTRYADVGGGMRELTLQKRLGHATVEATRLYTRVSDASVVAEYPSRARRRRCGGRSIPRGSHPLQTVLRVPQLPSSIAMTARTMLFLRACGLPRGFVRCAAATGAPSSSDGRRSRTGSPPRLRSELDASAAKHRSDRAFRFPTARDRIFTTWP